MKSQSDSRRRRHAWLRWSGRALLATGVLLLGYVALVSIEAKLFDIEAQRYVDQPWAENQARLIPRPETRGPESTPIEGQMLGHMEIPRLGVSAAVLQGTAVQTLRHGVGHIPGTVPPGTPGNSAIAGHRDTFFRALRNIRAGDEIELKTADSALRYRVDWARVVASEDISVLDNTRESVLTLVTCYPFYFIGVAPKRFVVRAHQVPIA